MKAYLQEFPNFDWIIPTKQLDKFGFIDFSWHQNACPSFVKPLTLTAEELLNTGDTTEQLTLWIDYKERTLREFEDAEFTQFALTINGVPQLVTDDWQEVIRYLKEK